MFPVTKSLRRDAPFPNVPIQTLTTAGNVRRRGRPADGGSVFMTAGRKEIRSMSVKYVFVTGGVVSGLGKGITAASLGRLLKARGYRVTMQKLDPYINVDPGTMNPIQHGDGPGSGPLRAVYRREPGRPFQRDHGKNLLVRPPQGASGRLRRPDGAGDPPHHQRDQEPFLPLGQGGLHRHHRGGRHRGRH